MNQAEHFDDFLREVATGEYDMKLDALADAIKRRRKLMAELAANEMAVTLRVGDRVQIRSSAPIGPKYLLETPIVVKKVNDKTISGDIEEPMLLPSERYARGIRVPLEHLDKLEPATP